MPLVYYSLYLHLYIFCVLLESALHLSLQMVVADVYNHRFHKIYRRDDSLNQIAEKEDIFV